MSGCVHSITALIGQYPYLHWKISKVVVLYMTTPFLMPTEVTPLYLGNLCKGQCSACPLTALVATNAEAVYMR